MSQYDKEIESLRNKLEKLESAKEKQIREDSALEQIESDLRAALEAADVSMDAFLGSIYRDVKRVVARMEKNKAPAIKEEKPKKQSKPKKTKAKPKFTIKIPAGTYGNIPSHPDETFIVNNKGPRLMLLKVYAKQLGEKDFIEQCKLS